MRILLDTCAFLWIVLDSPELSKTAAAAFLDGKNEIFLSAASSWEISIKARLGRLELKGDPGRVVPEEMRKNAIEAVPVEHSHALRTARLPSHHRDPFDRLLVAQCLIEGFTLMSPDPVFRKYDVKAIW